MTFSEMLTMGYIALSLGPNNAEMLLKHLMQATDRHSPIVQRYADSSYRHITNGQPGPIVDYYQDGKGTVVQQGMWRPLQPGDVHRHFENARMQVPIFFINAYTAPGGPQGVGIDLSLVGHPSFRQIMMYPDAPSLLGGLTTTHLCLKVSNGSFYVLH